MNTEKLPKGYQKIETIHLEKDKVHKRRINLIAMLLAVVLAMAGQAVHPFDEASSALMGKAWVLLALLGVLFAFMVLHELSHALIMYLVSHVKPKIAVKGLYCYAGSPVHFEKRSYLLVELIPALFWGAVLLALYFLLPDDWFWLVHIVQIANIAGAAGDFYSLRCIMKHKQNILIQDLGNGMKIYAPDHE